LFFLSSPGEVLLLQHYLALVPAERAGPGGCGPSRAARRKRAAAGAVLLAITAAARVAVAGLMWTDSDAGREALRAIAEDHADGFMRLLAEIALGRKAGRAHD